MPPGLIHYKFKSGKDFSSLPIESDFISLYHLKQELLHSNKLGSGKGGRCLGFDLLVTDYQTDQEYPENTSLIPNNTSVILHRVPLSRPKPIVVTEIQKPVGDRLLSSVSGANPNHNPVKTTTPSATTTTATSTITHTSSSSSTNRKFPRELRCPVCTLPMKDAVMVKKCCFRSLCHQCAVEKSKCACGARNIVADRDIAPNLTIRLYISRLLEDLRRLGANGGSDTDLEGLQQPDNKRRRLEVT